MPAHALCRTAPPERRMVGSILRSPEPRPGSYGNLRLVGSDPGNWHDVLESFEAGWCFDGPVSDLGEHRWDPKCHDLAAELIPELSLHAEGTALMGRN